VNQEQVKDFCMRYLIATNCHILEKDPAYVKVKLSPEADKDLTGRSYYWSFVERTGVVPETMSFVFVFDPETRKPPEPQGRGTTQGRPPLVVPPSINEPLKKGDSILERYFGVIPMIPQPGRMIEETISFGCRRLDLMFSAAHSRGSYLQLFEEAPPIQRGSGGSHSYTTWLGVNYKVEFTCDMKREELHSLGICMSTGEIVDHFQQYMYKRALSPRMPAHCQLHDVISLEKAVHHLEAHLEKLLQHADYEWARSAEERMSEEVNRIHSYYGDLLRTLDAEQKEEMQAQYVRRQQEIEWQYRPRVEVRAMNCGWFHLLTDTLPTVPRSFANMKQKNNST
jgi:hypothetical protein